MEAHGDRSHFREAIPDWLTLYVFLALGDLAFTLTALQLGAREANPFLDRALDTGLFEFVKISLTLLVLCVAYLYREKRIVKDVMSVANTFMAVLTVYHIAWLALFVF